MNRYAIIVAGGKGTRMGTTISKQYLPLKGLPILMHTLSKFYTYDSTIELTLVIPADDFDYWKQLCNNYNFTLPHQLVVGGYSRFQSVKNGLSVIENDGLVAVHDGVRPLVSSEIIEQSFNAAGKYGAAVASIDLKDSIREVKGGNNSFKNRANYRAIQTPQTFQVDLIKQAFETKELPEFTDDASVAEHAGHPIHLFEGSYQNLKITTTEDLKIAEALMN